MAGSIAVDAIFKLLTLPFKAVATLSYVFRLTKGTIRGPKLLPVAGIDEEASQSILGVLRQGARTEQEMQLSAQWLQSLQLAQVAADRLTRSLRDVDKHTSFWRKKLASGRQRFFLLTGQGPIRFVQQALSALHVQPPLRLAATAEMEAKLVTLVATRSAASHSLGTIHTRAAALWLLPGQPLPQLLAALQSLDAGRLFELAADAVLGTCSAVQESVEQAQQCCRELRGDNVLRASKSLLRRPPAPPSSPEDALAIAMATLIPPNSGVQQDRPDDRLNRTRSRLLDAAVTQDGRQLLGTCKPNTVAIEALTRAAVLAASQPPLIVLPRWVQSPSAAEQHWIRYGVYGVAAAWGTWFLYRHSRLSGSRDLEEWAQQAREVVATAAHENVQEPLLALQREVFRTFRDRPSIVSRQEFDTDRAALLRMLADFQLEAGRAHAQPPPAGPAAPAGDASVLPNWHDAPGSDAVQDSQSMEVARGMSVVMSTYEEQLKRPIRSLLAGDLARSLLIQIQKVKVDSAAAMLEMDQVLRANELSISLVAAMPALLVASFVARLLWRVATPTPPDPRREALPSRLAAIEMQRALGQVTSDRPESVGHYYMALASLYSRAWRLFRRHDMHSPTSEWQQLRRDLLDLAGPLTLQHKQAAAQRMMRSYTIFQQF